MDRSVCKRCGIVFKYRFDPFDYFLTIDSLESLWCHYCKLGNRVVGSRLNKDSPKQRIKNIKRSRNTLENLGGVTP